MSKKKYVVALIEDDQMLLKYLAASLRHEKDFDVYTASDGEEGEALIRAKKPDLVLLDVVMPKKNGFDVLASIKGDKATKGITIVMLSNLGQAKDIEKAKDLGAADYLVKVEFEVDEIVAKVKAMLA